MDLEELRGEVRKILESSGFAGAKQLQSFLSYSSEAVFQGRSSMEQIEIAREVLVRGDDFNPIDDPSVRKIASLLRQRLQRYYEAEGAHDRVVISLPLRSYLPVFQFRDRPPVEALEPEDAKEEADVAVKRRQWPAWLVAIALAVGVAAGYAARLLIPASVTAGEFRLPAVYGDMASATKDALQAGPEIREHDEVVVRMRFRPTQPVHQAGLAIVDDTANYVEMGRVFDGRSFLEFASHADGRFAKAAAQMRYDPEAQTLEPVWLAIRRNGKEYRAFTGVDGVHWLPFGDPRELPKPLLHPHVALYAFHGKTAAAPAEAVFDHLSVGPGLHDWTGSAEMETIFGGWQPDKTCAAVSNPVFDLPGLRFLGVPGGRPCTGEIVRPVPPGDWTISTRLDFVPVNGLLAGLQVRGAHGRFRVVRWSIDGNTITAERVHGEQAHLPDFAGSPPVTLRISCRNGLLQGSFSRDDVEYTELKLKVSLASLGEPAVVGFQSGKIGWLAGESTPPLIYWIHEDVTRLHPLK